MSRSTRWALILLCVCALPLSAQPRGRGRNRERVANDASRLAAVLHDVQYERVHFAANVWRTSANEAMGLANRIYDESGGRPEARDVRAHVRRMRQAVNHEDFNAARSEAHEALVLTHALSDWAAR